MFEHYFLFIARELMRVMRKLRISSKICAPLNILRHRYILYRLKPYFIKSKYMLNRYEMTKPFKYYNSQIIWMFWWQGECNMPRLIKLCVESVKNNYTPNKVILITKKNILSYVNFPNYIWEKLKKGRITLTHFSDILRFKLLRKYGGLWIDSTVFCTSKLIPKNFDYIYTSGGYNNLYKYYISAKWTAFLIGGCANNELFIFMDNLFNIYWEKNNYMIDYFLVDYGLYYAYLYNIGNFKLYVNRKAHKNNPHLPCLLPLLNKSFNKCIWKIIVSDTKLFKLTYKKHYRIGRNSFYNVILKKYNML